jgi:hypothetical protein
MGQNNIKFVADTPSVMLFSFLPTDIIHHILSYIGKLKYRNGKYMGQISTSDKRYELLLKIPRKICYMPSISTISTISAYYCYLYVNYFLTIQIYGIHNSNKHYKQPTYNYVFVNQNIIYEPK